MDDEICLLLTSMVVLSMLYTDNNFSANSLI